MNNSQKDYKASSFEVGLKMQLRVIGALLMREVITRFGRHNIGFLWLLMEPIIFTVGVVILWNLMHGTQDFKVEVTPFIVTGYSSLLLWRTCSFRGIKAIEPNRSLLHHRQVKIQDIFISRMILELSGVTASFFTLTLAMIGLGLMRWPENPLLVLAGWISMAWFSAILGTILGCLSEFSEMVERLWHPISYFLLVGSGTFYMVDWLPKSFHDIVLWIPMANAVEMMRGGYWGSAVRTHFSIGYMLIVCLTMSLLALLLMSDRRLKQLT